MKKICGTLIFIFTIVIGLSNVSADSSNLNTGSAGTWTPAGNGTKGFGSGLTWEQSGLRLTVVDEKGNKISSNVVDYWENGTPTGARMLAGSSYKTNIVNNKTLSFEMTSYSGFSQGNPVNINGAGKSTWQVKHQSIENLINTATNGTSCKNPEFLNELGYDLCSALTNDCEALKKIYILIEPLTTFHLIEDHSQKFVMSGTEYSFFLKNFAKMDGGLKIVRNQIGGDLWRNLVNMRLSCFKDNDDCTWNLKSGGAKYAYLNTAVNNNACDRGNCDRLNYHDGTLRDKNGNIYGTSMHLVWLGSLAKKCDTPNGGDTPEDDTCKYTPGENFKTECCDDTDYLNNYYKEHDADDFIEACCEIPAYGTAYSKIFSKETFDEKYGLYCEEPDKCKPLKLTGEAYCDTTTCDDESFSDNKSTFADPIFNSSDGKTLINSLTDSNGSVNLNLSEEQLKNIASNLSDDSFLAVAQQGETYKVDIGNKYCDLYCQEIAVVTLPNFSPAVNAGRFFQWYIDSDGNQPFIKQEVTRVCGEDIKLDQFMEDYYEWMYDIQDYVDQYVNANLSCDSAGPVYNYNEAFDGTISADAKCSFDYYCSMSRLKIPPCYFKDCGNESDKAACGQENEACKEAWKKLEGEIAGFNLDLTCCTSGCTIDGVKIEPYSQELKDMRQNFQNSDHSFRESFQELLECYSADLGTEIDTNLQFELDMSDLGNYYSEDSFTNFSSDSSKTVSSIAVCVDGQDCDDGIFSFKPEIDDYRDSGKSMTCNMDYWPSTDLLYEKYEIDCPNNTQSKVYSICKNYVEQRFNYASQSAKDDKFLECFENTLTLVNPEAIMYPSNHQFIAPVTNLDQNGDNKVSMKEACLNERDKCILGYGKIYSSKFNYTECLGDKQKINLNEKYWCRSMFELCDSNSGFNFEALCASMPDDVYTVQNNDETKCTIKPKKRRTSSVPNFLEGKNYDINNFPITVSDFSSKNTGNSTNGWTITETASKYNPDNINWFNTFRLIAQTKVDSYELNDGINACVCSDGTVGNLISKADAPSGMTVNGDYYCDCDPEESYNDYSNATSGSSSFVEVNERWGKCQYSGYTTIEEGSNYSIKYSMASGQYPLSVYYWNIGSIDLNDGNAHFDSMIDKCCSGGICSYAGDACKLIIGNAIMTDNWSNQYTNWWDLSASYYVCKNGQCKNPEPEPVCPDGECPPDTPDTPEPTCPDGDCDEPEPNCPEGNCANPSGLAIIYRTVDLNDPFPNRNAGENWQNLEGKISENRGVDGTDLYSSNLKPLYYFKFTPDVIKNIRAFNSAYGRDYSTSSTIAYPNNLMVKKDENGKNIYDENGNVIYTKGISQVLNNELIVYFARAAANNGDDLDEWFDVPLIQNCDDYYKAYSNDEDGNSYCVDIQDSFVVVQGDSECWQNVGVNPAYMGGEK